MAHPRTNAEFLPEGGLAVRPRPSAKHRRERVRQELQAWQDKALRREATEAIMNTLDVWGVSSREALELLGFSPASRGQIASLRRGERVLGPGEDTWRRAMGILSIQRSLEEFAPESPEWRDDWVQQPIAGLGYERPIDIMLGDGIRGIEHVRRYAKTLGHR